MVGIQRLEKLAKLVRYYILWMTSAAGSGHATSSLSATDLMVALFLNKLRFDLEHPENPNNDRVIFSKGHASVLLYALYAAAGVLTEGDLVTYRKFKSPLEGHPTPRFKFVEVATGSLGQGLSIGLGMALAIRRGFKVAGPVSGSSHPTLRQAQGKLVEFTSSEVERLDGTPSAAATRRDPPKVYVLMGDSETSEGSVWEAIQLASYYKVGNLVGIIDVNRLGQAGETMLGWDVDAYRRRFEAFGWQTRIVDGHDMKAIVKTFEDLPWESNQPQMIIAKTIKGRGFSFLENKDGWHGKALGQEDYEKAVAELGVVDKSVRGEIRPPEAPNSKLQTPNSKFKKSKLEPPYKIGEMIATRKAYGEAITALGNLNPKIVCLDGEVKNSTYAQSFAEKFPERFYEMFIAEQNMVSVAVGMAAMGYIPFASTFGVFFTRAFDQIRMAGYSRANVKFLGSHAGVSIGEDGPSQMALQDIAMFRTIDGSTILYPADGVAVWRMVELAVGSEGIFYIRTNRPATPIIYKEGEEFEIGGSKIVRSSKNDRLTVVACGVTLIEAIKAADELLREGISVRVIDAYSIKPIDEETLKEAADKTNGTIMSVEDHYFEGGLGDAVLNVFASGNDMVKVYKLAVSKMPMSGKSEELLDYEGISAGAIVKKVLEILG